MKSPGLVALVCSFVVLLGCQGDTTDQVSDGWSVGVDSGSDTARPDDPNEPDGTDDPEPQPGECANIAAPCPGYELRLDVTTADGGTPNEFSGKITLPERTLDISCPQGGGEYACTEDGLSIRIYEEVDEPLTIKGSLQTTDRHSFSGSITTEPFVETKTISGCEFECTGAEATVRLEERPMPEFSDSSIKRTCGPADGRALELVLGTRRQACTYGEERRLILDLWSDLPTTDDQTKKIPIASGSNAGRASLCTGDRCQSVSTATVVFETFVRGESATGKWNATLPDGSNVRGTFQAEWCGDAVLCG